METIRALNLRMDKVCIENLDWQKVLDLYDRSSTFFFIDPPYTECDAGMYSAWTNTDVQKLESRVAKLKGKWMLTLNDAPAIRAIFNGYNLKSVERPRGINNRGGKSVTYKELLITR